LSFCRETTEKCLATQIDGTAIFGSYAIYFENNRHLVKHKKKQAGVMNLDVSALKDVDVIGVIQRQLETNFKVPSGNLDLASIGAITMSL